MKRNYFIVVLAHPIYGRLRRLHPDDWRKCRLASEITGNGRILKQSDGTLHGQSECAYSGLNDVWEGDPDVPGPDGFFRTQSWGQLDLLTRIFLTSIGRNPGKACNPS